jgi:hypothetical protein
LRVLHDMRKREGWHDGQGTVARERGGAQPARWRRKGGRGKGVSGPLGWIGPLGQMAARSEEIKEKIEIYFESDF